MQRLDVSADNVGKILQLLAVSSAGGPTANECLTTLGQLDKMIGYRSCLLAIAAEQGVELSQRVAALSYLKNTTQAFWNRNNAKTTAFSSPEAEEERTFIKSTILSRVFLESHQVLANQLSDALGAIAKVDFPRFWPELIPSLLSVMIASKNETTNNIDKAIAMSCRAFDTIDVAFNAFAVKKKFSSKQAFEEQIVKAHLGDIHDVWQHFANLLLQALSSLRDIPNPEYLVKTTSLSQSVLLATKCVFRCVSNAAPYLCSSENNTGDIIYPALAKVMTAFADALNGIPSVPETIKLRNNLSRIRGYAANAVVDSQKDCPLAFRKYIVPFLQLFTEVIEQRAGMRQSQLQILTLEHSQDEIGVSWEADDDHNEEIKGNDLCSIQALNFISSVLLAPAYRSAADLNKNPSTNVAAMARSGVTFSTNGISFDHNGSEEMIALLDSFFNEQWCKTLIQKIVVNYFPWNRYDYKVWIDEPELFYHRNKLNRADVDERAAAESCLCAIAARKPEYVMPMLRDWLSSVINDEIKRGGPCPSLHPDGEEPPNSETITAHWLVNSVVFAVGLVMFELRTMMDILPLVNHVISQVESVVSKVGQAGLANLVISCTPQTVIMLQRAAWIAGQFTDVVDPATIERLCSLVVCLTQVGDPAVRLFAVSALDSYVDSQHMDDIIQSFTATDGTSQSFMEFSITNLLKLCTECTELESKAVVLTAVKHIVERVGTAIIPTVPLLMKALPELWEQQIDDAQFKQNIVLILLSLVHSLKGQSQGMHNMLYSVIYTVTNVDDFSSASLMEIGIDLWHGVLVNAVEITEPLLALFENWLKIYNTCEDAFETGIQILESYIILGRDVFLQRYGSALVEVLFSLHSRIPEDDIIMLSHVLGYICQLHPDIFLKQFPPLIGQIITNIQNYVLNGDDALGYKVILSYYEIFSHLFIHDFQGTLMLLNSMKDQQDNSPVDMIIDDWVNSFDLIAEMYKRKQSAMALMQFFTVNEDKIMRKADKLMNIIAAEVAEDEIPENFFVPSDVNVPIDQRTEEYRVKVIANNDVSNQGRLRDWVVCRLTECAKLRGQDFVSAVLQSVRPDLLAALRL